VIILEGRYEYTRKMGRGICQEISFYIVHDSIKRQEQCDQQKSTHYQVEVGGGQGGRRSKVLGWKSYITGGWSKYYLLQRGEEEGKVSALTYKTVASARIRELP